VQVPVYGGSSPGGDGRRLHLDETSVNNSRGRPSSYSENPDFIDGFVEIEMHADHLGLASSSTTI
jgi:hypothetical protein